MKRALQVLLAISFATMFLISPVAAATSQGLEWGVALDDEFTYQMELIDDGPDSFDEGINFTIIEIPPTIDDPLTNWTHIGEVDLNVTFYNGTSLGLYTLLFLGLLVVNGYIAVPVGNYSLLTELVMAESTWNENFTLIDNDLFWGMNLTATNEDVKQTIVAEYLKEDGFLSRYLFLATNITTSEIYGVTVIRNNLPVLSTTTTTTTSTTTTNTTSTDFDIVGLVTDNILYISIGLGIIIIGAVVCIRRK